MCDGAFNAHTAASANYVLSSWLFLRLLGFIYCAAFVSLAVQITGLVGRRGILPAAEFLQNEKAIWGPRRFALVPTVCWWNCSDGFLKLLCWSGAILSVLLIIGFAPVPVLFGLWLLYLSLLGVTQIFLHYQWDILLLETGFLAIFLAPLEWLPQWLPAAEPSPVVRWLFYWLLFRLMFSSGYTKLRSGDPAWRKLTSLNYHYETQPLSTPLSWYVHQLPLWFHKLSAALMFVIELAAPFLIFGPAPVRYAAGVAFVALMLLIMATGNYCFFNLLAIALSVLLFDDAVWRAVFREFPSAPLLSTATASGQWPLGVIIPIAVMVLALSLQVIARLFRLQFAWPKPLEILFDRLEPFRLVNSYGLFAVMTTVRLEIIVEGSNDGVTWRPYEFKWKPGDVQQRPRWAAPHQPRLDWQMWFAALSDYPSNPWFAAFLIRLLDGTPEVMAFLRTNPFPHNPPQLIRATVYEYHFTDFATRRATGAYWRRESKWLYCPVLSLDERTIKYTTSEELDD